MPSQLNHYEPLQFQIEPAQTDDVQRGVSPFGRFIGSLICTIVGIFFAFPFMPDGGGWIFELTFAIGGAFLGWLVYRIGSRMDSDLPLPPTNTSRF